MKQAELGFIPTHRYCTNGSLAPRCVPIQITTRNRHYELGAPESFATVIYSVDEI